MTPLHRIKLFASIFLFLALKINCVRSQDLPPLQADRPDQTESPYTVPLKHFQAEIGFALEKVNSEDKNYFYPASLWKYGLTQNLEFRLTTELLTNRSGDITTNGFNPISIGFKINICKEKGIIPMTSFIGHISIPALGSKYFKSSYMVPGFRFTMQHSLSDWISLGYNLGAEWDGETAEPILIYTLTSGFSFTDKFGGYIEIYGFDPIDHKADHRADLGFTYYITDNILIDVSGGPGLTDNAPDYFFALGFSIRLPD